MPVIHCRQDAGDPMAPDPLPLKQSIETTMIYTHVIRTLCNRPESPLDMMWMGNISRTKKRRHY